MPRPIHHLLALAFAGACVSMPAQETPEAVPARGSADQAFACAMRHVNELGYEVLAADRDAGFLRARRETTSTMTLVLTSDESFDVLTVTIYPAASGAPMLRVVARGEDRGSEGRDSTVASDRGYRDAAAIREACGGWPS